MHIENLDLNLLKALEILLDERHISRAATRAHITQPAMSRALARLRVACDDELLVRTPAGYELTARARTLQDELIGVMRSIRAMFDDIDFDPSTASGSLRIAASDYPVSLLGSRLFPTFTREAPKMSLIVTPVAPSSFVDLDQGRVDLVLTPLAAPEHLARQPMFTEDFVCVLARSNPLRAERLTVDDLTSHGLASVGGMHPQQTIVLDQLERLGAHATAEIRVPTFSAAISAVRDTDLIAVLPRRFANRHADEAVRIAEAPEEIAGFSYWMLWHPRVTDDREHQWLRSLVLRVAEEATAD
ncbi:LysR family transcriptional regulator [Agromyces rhizosphaerae]|uniref:LysR family transcriptional regulator n=1 Tax=Agromyces rhizosphaerae TaxID=88374 RepID=UPI00248FB9A2|nr:LysR family transcriptional regulator [Agromyces rhizosphaerae]